MWAVASCPKCNKQVAVPTSANASSVMRCPLCRAEYPLEEALNNLPPELEVVSSTQPLDEPSEISGAPLDFPFIPPPEAPRPAARAERSTTRLMLEVIVGGLLAGPIALFIIMWGFGKDPLHMSTKLPRFMVPPCLRADAGDHEPIIMDAN